MEFTQHASTASQSSVPLMVEELEMCWVEAARLRSDTMREDPSSPALGGSSRQAEHMSEGVSPLVVALCYEQHLHMHAMLTVLAEQRGDDPDVVLGSPDCSS
jgi:hypothetical protein